MDPTGRVRDLLAAAERQCAHRSFDAAIATFQTALELLGGDPGALRELIEARLVAVRHARENAHQASRLAAQARYEEQRGNRTEAFRLTCEALELDAASAEAASLRHQLELLTPQPEPAAPPPPVEVTAEVPPMIAEVIDDPLPIPSFALPPAPPPPDCVKDHQAALVLLYCLAVGCIVIAAGANSRPHVNLDGPIRVSTAQQPASEAAATPWDGMTYVVDGKTTMPVLLSRFDPPYPPIQRDSRLPDRVEVEFEIDPTGTPINPRVLGGANVDCDIAAMQAVGRWRFQPGMEGGKPVSVAARGEVIFRKP